MDKTALIRLVKERRALWHQRDKRYHNREVKQLLWAEIGEKINSSGDEAKKNWELLRDVFRREIKKIMLGHAEECDVKWVHFENMLFLKDNLRPRKTSTSLLKAISVAKEEDGREGEEELGNECVDPLETSDLEPSPIPTYKRKNLSDLDPSPIPTYKRKNLSDLEPSPIPTYKRKNLSDFDPSSVPTYKRKNLSDMDPSPMPTYKRKNLSDFEPSPVPTYKRKNFQEEALQLVRRKMKLKERMKGRTDTKGDEDYHFLMSILPSIKKLGEIQKMKVRMEFLQIVTRELTLIEQGPSCDTFSSSSNQGMPTFPPPGSSSSSPLHHHGNQ